MAPNRVLTGSPGRKFPGEADGGVGLVPHRRFRGYLNREIGFRFRFVFVSCVRAGEAKLRERASETLLLNAGATAAEMCSGGGSGA